MAIAVVTMAITVFTMAMLQTVGNLEPMYRCHCLDCHSYHLKKETAVCVNKTPFFNVSPNGIHDFAITFMFDRCHHELLWYTQAYTEEFCIPLKWVNTDNTRFMGWRVDMVTFSASLVLCERQPIVSFYKGPIMGRIHNFVGVCLNKTLHYTDSRVAGHLRCHDAHKTSLLCMQQHTSTNQSC